MFISAFTEIKMNKYNLDCIDLSGLTQVLLNFNNFPTSASFAHAKIAISNGADCCQNLQSIKMFHHVCSVNLWWFVFIIFAHVTLMFLLLV